MSSEMEIDPSIGTHAIGAFILARLHLLGPIFAIFAGLFAGKPLYPMTRTVWNRL
jgi:hypothetical protein